MTTLQLELTVSMENLNAKVQEASRCRSLHFFLQMSGMQDYHHLILFCVEHVHQLSLHGCSPLQVLTSKVDIAFLMKLLQLIKAVITKDLCLYLYFILNMRKRGKEG